MNVIIFYLLLVAFSDDITLYVPHLIFAIMWGMINE